MRYSNSVTNYFNEWFACKPSDKRINPKFKEYIIKQVTDYSNKNSQYYGCMNDDDVLKIVTIFVQRELDGMSKDYCERYEIEMNFNSSWVKSVIKGIEVDCGQKFASWTSTHNLDFFHISEQGLFKLIELAG